MVCPGFRFAGVACGVKASGALDLGLLVCDRPATAAAIFTRNQVVAAPVVLSRGALARSGGVAQAAVVNSGNANACTGARGLADARAMAAKAATALGARTREVVVASTGVIGQPLPTDRVEAGIAAAAAALRPRGFRDFSRAILTTDRGPKSASRKLSLAGAGLTLLGCTKGAGMIAPDMATTLTFVATDIAIGATDLDRALRAAARDTFNALTIDSDTSTNDMILVMAGGAAGNRRLGVRDRSRFTAALEDLLGELARKLVADGEGVHHLVTVRVRGARNREAARQVARSIAESPLVKTAIAGADPNWGRVFMAAGKAGVPLRGERLTLWIGGVKVAEAGAALGGAAIERRARAAMRRRAYDLVLDLGQGRAEAAVLGCDLSHDYVTINADYRT